VSVFENLTVRENIDYFCGLYIDDKSIRKEYVDEAIEFVALRAMKSSTLKSSVEFKEKA